MAQWTSPVGGNGEQPAFWNLEKKGSLPHAGIYRNNILE